LTNLEKRTKGEMFFNFRKENQSVCERKNQQESFGKEVEFFSWFLFTFTLHFDNI